MERKTFKTRKSVKNNQSKQFINTRKIEKFTTK